MQPASRCQLHIWICGQWSHFGLCCLLDVVVDTNLVLFYWALVCRTQDCTSLLCWLLPCCFPLMDTIQCSPHQEKLAPLPENSLVSEKQERSGEMWQAAPPVGTSRWSRWCRARNCGSAQVLGRKPAGELAAAGLQVEWPTLSLGHSFLSFSHLHSCLLESSGFSFWPPNNFINKWINIIWLKAKF